MAPKSICVQGEWHCTRSGGISSLFWYPAHPRSCSSSTKEGPGPPRIAAFHKLTSGPTVTSNFPAESWEYRKASPITRYKSGGTDGGRECEECFKRLRALSVL